VRAAAALLAASALFAAAPATASAATTSLKTLSAAPVTTAPPDPNGLTIPGTWDRPPPAHRLAARQAAAIADRLEKVRETRANHPASTREVYQKGFVRWQVSYFARGPHGTRGKEIAQVLIDDASGAVLEAWTGYQVAWTMARGYPGAFGRVSNALYIWIPLCFLFIAPFFDFRRPFRWLHLDLLAVLAFSVSFAFFTHANIGMSVALTYPPLLYLLARAIWIGLRRPARGDPAPHTPPLFLPSRWLVVALVFLVAFRVGLNVVNSNVIDVGYASVVGADRLADGAPLYKHFPKGIENGDTYGPVVYESYVPFEQGWSWSGAWDDLHAAHAAAIAFDLITILLLYLLGVRLRGSRLGIALAFAWAACPFTLFTLASNSNDTLVGLFVALGLFLAAGNGGRPMLRGAAVVLGGLTKVATFALGPLYATWRRPGDPPPRRTVVRFALGCAIAAAVALAPIYLRESLSGMYDRTVGIQAGRESPFSVWGVHPNLDWLHVLFELAVAGFAVAVAFLPKRRDIVGLAALTTAVVIAVQLTLIHWFYLYVPWFLPALLVAVLARGEEDRVSLRARGAGSARSHPRAAVATP
jgi:hypothetical protein